ncbi:MAG: hypothetical protein ACJ8BW_10755 [Ktedonobacteraceae bacterium]
MIALLYFIQQKSRSYISAFKIHAKQAEDVAMVLAAWIRTQGMMILSYMKNKSTVLTAWARGKGMVILAYIKDVEVVFLTRVKAGGTSFLKWARATGIMLMTNAKAYRISSVEHLRAMAGALMVRTKEGGTTIVTGIQHAFLAERNITAAALIETPLRVQPGQDYAVRINLLGRDEPALSSGIQEEAPLAGLSALAQGELVHIEVHTAIAQKDVSVVQQADAYIPRHNYMTEVTLPMHPRSHASLGQRERVHIFFMDKMYRPLYEKPFVIELFISPLVKYGHEGYYALPIPL